MLQVGRGGDLAKEALGTECGGDVRQHRLMATERSCLRSWAR